MTEPSKRGNVQDAWARWKFTVLKIGELFDVDTSAGPTSGQALLWNSTDKKWEPGTAGGFDPNEDPVIIGSGATAGGGSTPSSPAGGSAGSVAVGASAAASVGPSVAVGDGATATHASSVAVGDTASATAGHTIAVGSGSISSGSSAIAIGYTAQSTSFGAVAIGVGAIAGIASPSTAAAPITIGSGASGDQGSITIGANAAGAGDGSVLVGANTSTTNNLNQTVIGTGASTTGTYGTALGAGAVAAAHQVMLGTSAETVVMPGNFDGSHLPTTNPGAGSGLVWNNSGVLTVA